MTPQLYLKLSRQIARQQPELADYHAQIAAAQPAIDTAQTALDAAIFTAAASQAALEALQSDAASATAADAQAEIDRLAPLIESAQATATADATTASTAQSALQALTGPRDVLQGHADAIAASIAACQAALVDTGETPTQAEVDAYSLTQDRATVWARIKWHRDMCKAEGVKVGDKWFHSDVDSRIQQLGLVMMGASVPPVPWKTMDGTFITMTPTLAGQIFQATAARDMAVFAAAEQHRAAVNASTDPLAYPFTATGWPAGYVG